MSVAQQEKTAATFAPQIERIVCEVETLAARAGVDHGPPPALAGVPAPKAVCHAVKWAFTARRQLLAAQAEGGSWRQSFSRLGPPTIDDADFVVSEYQRTELTVPPGSPLASFYPWIPSQVEDRVVVRYLANGMAAVGVFLLGLARWARATGCSVTLLGTPLYHETRQLLGAWMFDNLVEFREFADVDALLAAVAQADGPHVIYLDSAESVDTRAAIVRLAELAPSDTLLALAWDNSCIAHDDAVALRRLPAPLYLLRSHLKLDQMGLELGPLGSLCVMPAGPAGSAANAFLHEFLPRLPLHGRLFGTNASADLLRRLNMLGLPDPVLTPAANAATAAATRHGVDCLAAVNGFDGDAVRLLRFPHGCFCQLMLPPVDGSALAHALGLAARLHDRAVERSVPLINSASFGFPFTGVTGFAVADPDGPLGAERPVVRVAFGGHDAPVTEAVAAVVVEGLAGTNG